MNKNIFLFVPILLMFIFLIGTISALDLTPNIKYYNESSQELIVRDSIFWIFLTDDILKATLDTPKDNIVGAGYQKVAQITINPNKDYSNLINSFEFYNLKDNNKKVTRQIDLKYLTTELVEENTYGNVCEQKSNGTSCSYGITGTKLVEREVWQNFNNSIKTDEEIVIGLFTNVEVGDKIEWIPKIANVRVTEWATWTADLNANLISYWKLDEAVNGTVVDELENASSINVGATVNVDGKINTAYNFTTDDYISLGANKFNFTGTDQFAISSWIYLYTTSGDRFIFAHDAGAPQQYGWKLGGSNKIYMEINGDVDIGIRGNAIVNTSTWTHIVFVANSTSFISYINGNLDKTTLRSNIPIGPATNGAIGRRESGGYFEGKIDEVAVWGRALTVAEVTQLYNSGAGLPYSSGNLTIDLLYPENSYNTTRNSIYFVGNVSELLSGTGITNVSLKINGTINQTNSSGFDGIYNFTTTLPYGAWNWTIEAWDNSTPSNNKFSVETRTLTNAQTIVGSITYAPIVYETQTTALSTNILTSGSSISSGELIYNTTNYTATVTNLGGNSYNISYPLDVPAVVTNNTFYFNYTIGGTEYSTGSNAQQVDLSYLSICNSTYSTQFINFTFLDEETFLNTPASIDSSTWEYWLGSGSITKSYLYSNTTELNTTSFCFVPSSKTVHNTRSVQYSGTGYPQRKYDTDSDLTSSTLNQTLYLLSSADGIYSTTQVVDQDGNRIEGVSVTVERQFSGIWVTIGQEETDGSGAVTFWLNPDYDHRYTFEDEDCTYAQETIRPTQTQYTQQLSCTTGLGDITTQLDGIKYARTPIEGIIQTGVTNFTYQIVSSKDNIVNASFKIVNSSDLVILNQTSSTCSPSGCSIWFLYNVTAGANIKGYYYVNVGNGTILLEADAHWVNVYIPSTGKAGIGTFFKDVIRLLNGWGTDSSTADFNRLVVVFMFMCIAISALNFTLGNPDSQNPGAFLVIMTVIILGGSMIGGLTGQGLFYFNNLFASTFINNYLLAMICIIISVSYFINVNRQANK